MCTHFNKATKIRHTIRCTKHWLYVTDRPWEAVPITKVDKTVTIQYLEKDIRVLTQSLPFPDGKLSPEEDKDLSKVIQQVRGRDRIQLKSCLLGLFYQAEYSHLAKKRKQNTQPCILEENGDKGGKESQTGHIQCSSFPWGGWTFLS